MNTGLETSSPDPAFVRAAEIARRLPLRWSNEDHGASAEEVFGRGWFLGPGECVRVLMDEAPANRVAGLGFGRTWPLLVGSDRWTIAPGLPVAVGPRAVIGGGCELRREGDVILREVAGSESPYLADGDVGPAPGEPFDLMWFGDAESYRVRAGVLEIQDLFGVLRVPASRILLEALIVRRRRVPESVLSSIDFGDPVCPFIVEVSRPAALAAHGRWRDPLAFLEARQDVERATVREDETRVSTVTGETAVFDCKEGGNGWRLALRSGNYPLREIRLELRNESLVLSAALDRGIDPMAPGVRQRLIFDLRADLVELG